MPSCSCAPSSNDSEKDLLRKILTRLCENGGQMIPATAPAGACCPNQSDGKFELLRKILIGVCAA